MVAYPILTTRAPLLDTADASFRGLLGTKPIDMRRLMMESSSDVRRTIVPLSPTSMSFRETTEDELTPHPPWHEPQEPSDSPVQRTLMHASETSCPAEIAASAPPSLLEMRHLAITLASSGPGSRKKAPA
jgi:hypothetical protein